MILTNFCPKFSTNLTFCFSLQRIKALPTCLMNHNQHHLVDILFRIKIYEYKGSEFQKFFVEIMEKSNPNFRSIKPHGKEGDWKNDGYDSITGTFYQVYAPEKPADRTTNAVKKLNEAFEGLLEKWNSLVEVKRFYFAYNDEFKYANPKIEEELLKLTQKHGIRCEPFLAKDLRRVFDLLTDEDKMICLHCFVPNVDDLSKIVGYEALNEVVKHVVNLPFGVLKPLGAARPGFIEKIQFNSLSDNIAQYLIAGEYQIGALQKYFEFEPDLKIILQEKFSGLYEQGKKEISAGNPERNDEIFIYIFAKSTPLERPNVTISNAVFILMSYYFECCDIFEPPKTTLFD